MGERYQIYCRLYDSDPLQFRFSYYFPIQPQLSVFMFGVPLDVCRMGQIWVREAGECDVGKEMKNREELWTIMNALIGTRWGFRSRKHVVLDGCVAVHHPVTLRRNDGEIRSLWKEIDYVACRWWDWEREYEGGKGGRSDVGSVGFDPWMIKEEKGQLWRNEWWEDWVLENVSCSSDFE